AFGFTPVEGLLVVWRSSNRVEGWRLGERRPSFTFEAGPPAGFRLSRDGRALAAARGGGTVTLYHVAEGTGRRPERVPASRAPRIEFSPDGRFLAAVGGNYRQPERTRLHVHDLRGQQPPLTVTHPDSIHDIAWYPDGRAVAAGGWNESND